MVQPVAPPMLDAELKKKGVTKQLPWQEYLAAHPGGYQYSRFRERHGRWLATASVTLRQEHRSGSPGPKLGLGEEAARTLGAGRCSPRWTSAL